ncbi:LacI family DNA-binding transcriptional regulator [Oscillospiraceae bacterium LTW-04]|nr:LacI family DNA-binding transcriptional regulator [Oscillospiraceae bacterium MB24-C1]
MSIKRIAQMTGLSITTVSHAINGTRAVSQHSKQLVDEAVKEIGYKPNLAAQMLKTNRSHIIALIIPSTEPNNSTNCFFFDVLNGAREQLHASGYDLMVATYSEQEGEKHLANLQVLEKRLVDGVLLVPFDRDPTSLTEIRSLGIPIVLVDRRVDNCSLPSVYSDNLEGARKAVHLLAQNGRKRIAFLCGNSEFSTSYDRHLGYLQGIKEAGLPINDDLIFIDLPYQLQTGKNIVKTLLDNRIDAVFSANNVLLMGLLQYFNEHHISVPHDISVVGFDDYDWMNITTSPVTATFQNPYLMGCEAARMMLETLEGKDTSNQQIALPCELVLRESHKS